MGTCFFALAVLFFLIGLVQLFAPDKTAGGLPRQPQGAAPFPSNPQGVQPRQGPAQRPVIAPAEQPISSGSRGGSSMTVQPFNWIQKGQRIRVTHPEQGELTLYVMGQISYEELWQQTRGPQSPWVPTGNVFLGFWLENNLFLLNWQNRAYLLEERIPLSDADIQRDFAPHAKKFAQSDQTADVYFAYPPASWHIDDIGKFRVQGVEGEGFALSPGATGRFIHSSGDGRRALVLEDYEGGGSGQDTAWIGYQIETDDVKKS